jgi:uncharacterized YccA/Bax inhibitor family protein
MIRESTETKMPEKSGNPTLSDKTFSGLGVSDNPMTLAGTVNKTAILLAILRLLSKRR